MNTYRIILRNEPGKLEIKEATIQAKNKEEATKAFEDKYGVADIVAGPFKVEAKPA